MQRFIHPMYIRLIGAIARLTPSPDHMVFVGSGSAAQLCAHIMRLGHRRVLVVTDKVLAELGVIQQATAGMAETGNLSVFDGVEPDPDFTVVDAGLAALRAADCDAVLAIGGGSSIDAAKIIAAAATNTGPARDYIGYNKFKQPPLPLFALPTTAGTGSEATMGAVITDEQNHSKVIITDGRLAPLAVALDPELMAGMPPHITAATGMDALTHAVEAWLGTWERDSAKQYALLAVRLIFENLARACESGDDLQAREGMALAAWYAGLAINQVNVGSVHAISHQLGARYGVPHGLGNACVLPGVLDFSLPAAEAKLARLGQEIGLTGDNDAALAAGFVAAVRQLNDDVGIPKSIDALRPEDIAELADAAVRESFNYPVPRLMTTGDAASILRSLSPDA